MKMNKHYNELKASYLFVDIAHKVAAYQEAHPEKEIIRLGIGDVTQPLAKCVVKAMHDAADEMGTKEGFHGYGPEQGYPFLKQAIQGYYAGRGTQLAEDEIFISDGAKSDLANVLGLFDVDNTVLVPDPVYPTYVDDNVTDGRKIIYSRTSQENGFLGMPDENVKADIIYICSPNNPTGAAYTRDQLKAWVDYAKKNDAIILYDAAYECFISDGELAIREMKRLNDSIKDETISRQIDRLEEVSGKIFDCVKADPEKLPQIRKFMNYYLPTTLKLLNAYDRMSSQGVEGQNISGTMERVESMMSNIVTAFERQLDSLFGDQALDISTDITVLENMMAREGLVDSPLKAEPDEKKETDIRLEL